MTPPTWDELLAAVAAGEQRLVLETADGARAVLVAESELTALEAAASRGGSVALSPREVEVLRLVAAGCTGAETAARLGLAPNTVAQHLASARRRLGVRSSAAAVEAARREGLLPDQA